jgi:hypothetical protein
MKIEMDGAKEASETGLRFGLIGAWDLLMLQELFR